MLPDIMLSNLDLVRLSDGKVILPELMIAQGLNSGTARTIIQTPH